MTGAGPILTATGPVYVPAYKRWVDSKNVAQLIEHYHLLYVRHVEINPSDTKSQSFLFAVFRAIVRKVQTLNGTRLIDLADGVHAAIDHQQILMYSRIPIVEQAIEASGATGAIGPEPNDSLLVVDHNLSYNKINNYVGEKGGYDIYIDRDLGSRSVLRLRYHNRRSPGDIYGDGPFDTRTHIHTYLDWIRVFVPPGTVGGVDSGLSGCPVPGGDCFWNARPAYGMTELGAGMFLPEYKTRTAVFRYRIPPGVFGKYGSNRYVLSVERQPSSWLKKLTVTIHVAAGMTVGTEGKRVETFNLRLKGPRTLLRVPLTGASAHPEPLKLEQGPWSDPWLPNRLFKSPFESF